MSEILKEFTDSNFATEAMGSSTPVIVDFWATWCGPCKMLTPILEEIAKEIGTKVVIGKLNVDDHPETASRYGITNIPSMLFIKDGQVINQFTGLLAKKPLLDKINKSFGLV